MSGDSTAALAGPVDRPINHLCYTVVDLVLAASHWATAFGVGPFLYVPPRPGDLHFHGCTTDWQPRLAFGQWGPIGVELMEISTPTPPSLGNELRATDVGLNHVAYVSPTPEEDSAHLESLGMPRFLTSRRGPVETTWHTASQLGHLIEIHRETEFILDFFANVASAASQWGKASALLTLSGEPISQLEEASR